MADELLGCKERLTYQANDQVIRSVFFRRTGVIAAALAITVEAPDVINVPEVE